MNVVPSMVQSGAPIIPLLPVTMIVALFGFMTVDSVAGSAGGQGARRLGVGPYEISDELSDLRVRDVLV